MRLIDVDELKSNADITNWDKPYGCSFSAIDNTETKKDKWIKCESNKMPENEEIYKGKHIINCLVTTSTGKVTKVQRIQYKNYDGKFEDSWHWGRIFGACVAWQPLPEPYKCK